MGARDKSVRGWGVRVKGLGWGVKAGEGCRRSKGNYIYLEMAVCVMRMT